MIAMTDANGVRTEYQYDDAGRRIAAINAQGQVSRTVYDKVGNVIAEATPLLNRTEYRYDNRDLKVAVIDARYTGLSQTEQKLTSFAYDKIGNLLSVTESIEQHDKLSV